MIDFSLSPLTEGDLPLLAHLQPADWSDITAMHRFYLSSQFAHPYKVIVGGNIAGIGSALILSGTAWLAHIIVAEEFRNRGIGAFISASLRDIALEKFNCKTVSLIASDMGLPVYKKQGFVVQGEYNVYTTSAGQPHFPPSEHVIPADEEHLSGILSLDRMISGEDRQAVIRQHLDGAYVYEESGRLTGAYLTNLGEGLIIANDKTSGIELLKRKVSECDRLTLPAENTDAGCFLREAGFTKLRSVTRMFYGDAFQWEPRSLFSRLGGYLG